MVGGLACAPLGKALAQGTGISVDANINRSQSDKTFAEAERALLAGRTPLFAGIALDIPTLSENGNSVDVGIKVESPWTRDDHVRAIHILSEMNPFPLVARFQLGYRSGRADVATRIRLAATQKVVVLAETSRGLIHRAEQEVIVILGACLDGG
jgi:sulfur-oxidizing protein SoxY